MIPSTQSANKLLSHNRKCTPKYRYGKTRTRAREIHLPVVCWCLPCAYDVNKDAWTALFSQYFSSVRKPWAMTERGEAAVLANGTDANKNLAAAERQRVQETIQLHPLIEIDIIGRAWLRLLFHFPFQKTERKGRRLWSVPCKTRESAAGFGRLACAVQQPGRGPYYLNPHPSSHGHTHCHTVVLHFRNGERPLGTLGFF